MRLTAAAGSQRSDGARQCGDGEPRGLRQAARPERSVGLAERVHLGRDDNNVREQTSDDAGEEAEVAKAETNQSVEANGAPPPDEEGFVWPEGAAPQTAVAVASVDQEEPAPDAPLPSLDDLVKRIPPDVRETLDDLFRVRFISVKRVAQGSLRS